MQLNQRNNHQLFVPVVQMSHPCQSLASLTASTAAWVSPLQPWGAAKEAPTTAPSPWNTASSLLKTSSMTSAPTAPTASLNHRGHFRQYPDTSLLSPAWSIPTLPFLSWPRAVVPGSTRLWGPPWGPPTAPARTSPQAAAADTQTFLPVRPPGWMKWTTVSFDLSKARSRTCVGLVTQDSCCVKD